MVEKIPVEQRLEQILTQYGARLRILLRTYNLARHGIDINDVEQEVRIRLWNAIQRDRSGAFGASYIQRVVATTVIDALRRAQVRAAEPLPEDENEPVEDIFGASVGPERRSGDRQQMECLAKCLAALPERRRISVTLHLQGFSMREVAEMANIASAEAARKLVSRGMQELRERLREFGIGETDEQDQ